jgi:hypothetical protein
VNVRVQAPPGVGAAQTFSGRHINVGPNGIVEMSEEDAFYLIPVGWTILGDADLPARQANRPSGSK